MHFKTICLQNKHLAICTQMSNMVWKMSWEVWNFEMGRNPVQTSAINARFCCSAPKGESFFLVSQLCIIKGETYCRRVRMTHFLHCLKPQSFYILNIWHGNFFFFSRKFVTSLSLSSPTRNPELNAWRLGAFSTRCWKAF